MSEVSESSRDIAFQLNLDSLDLALVDLLFLQIVGLRELDVGLCALDVKKLGLGHAD